MPGISVQAQSFTALHTFGSVPYDGNIPGGIITEGGVIYGTTSAGGQFGSGTVFRMNVNGSAYTNVYHFSAVQGLTQTNTDGANPGGTEAPGSPLVLSAEHSRNDMQRWPEWERDRISAQRGWDRIRKHSQFCRYRRGPSYCGIATCGR